MNLEEVADLISRHLFKGLPLDGLEDCIYEEIPAVYLWGIMGLEAIVAGGNGEYSLVIAPSSDLSDEMATSEQIDISTYIIHLLKGVEGITCREIELEKITK